MGTTFTIMVICWFAISIIGCGMKAKEKGHSVFVAVTIGAIFGLFALIVYSVLPSSNSLMKKCPSCAELVLKEAKVCKHCHGQLNAA